MTIGVAEKKKRRGKYLRAREEEQDSKQRCNIHIIVLHQLALKELSHTEYSPLTFFLAPRLL